MRDKDRIARSRFVSLLINRNFCDLTSQMIIESHLKRISLSLITPTISPVSPGWQGMQSPLGPRSSSPVSSSIFNRRTGYRGEMNG